VVDQLAPRVDHRADGDAPRVGDEERERRIVCCLRGQQVQRRLARRREAGELAQRLVAAVQQLPQVVSARSAVSQAVVATPWAASCSEACTMAVILPKPAGARTSTSVTTRAAGMRWHTAPRGTSRGGSAGGLSFSASSATASTRGWAPGAGLGAGDAAGSVKRGGTEP
jgi:hypothetical protein